MSYNQFQSRRKRSRARRKQKLFLFGGAFLSFAVITSVFFITARGALKKSNDSEANLPNGAILSESSGPEVSTGEPSGIVTVEGVDISGLSRAEAEKKLTEAFPWGIQVEFDGEQFPVENQLEPEIGRILDQVYGQDRLEAADYSFNEENLRQGAAAVSSGFASKFNRSPVDSQVVSYNQETRVYEYSKEKYGLKIEEEKLADSILKAVEAQDFDAVLSLPVTEIPPARTQAQAKEQYQVIGTFTTQTTNNKNRNQNIRLAVDSIDGRVLQPGEEFSFNLTTGNRTKEKGYQPAGAYKNGVLIEEPGGGVCQVSTTLYHAIISSGFKTTERNSHSFAPSYVQQGQDAMVSFDGYAGPDLKFVNTSEASVVLRAAFQNNQLKLSIVGLPVLEKGVKVSIRSEQVGETAPPAPTVEENPGLPYGEQREVESAKKGTVWKSYRVLTKNGEVIEETPLHNSNYRPKGAVIQQNTTVPTPPSVEESQSEIPADGTANVQDGAQGGTVPNVPAENPVTGPADSPAGPSNEGAGMSDTAGGQPGASGNPDAAGAAAGLQPGGASGME